MISKSKITILALILLLTASLGQAGCGASREPPEKITISTSMTNVAGLLFVARAKGFFANNGLEVTLKAVASGNVGLEELKAGTADIAAFTEFAMVSGILGGFRSLRCLGAIAAADDIQLITAKDRGISRPNDLKGKRIGVFRGSNAEFFLGRFLTLNDLALEDVGIVNLNPSAMAAALMEGRVDAVMVWEPAAAEIIKKLENKTVSWPGQGGQPYFWLLASTDRFIKERPGAPERLLRSLAQAEEYIKSHQEESIDIIAAQVKLDAALLRNIRPKYVYEVSFDQSLLIAMEDQARWMIKNRLTQQTQVPNYLDYILAEPLRKVNPKAVRLVIPGHSSPK